MENTLRSSTLRVRLPDAPTPMQLNSAQERHALRRLEIRNLTRNFEAVEDLKLFYSEQSADLVTIGWSVSPMDLLMVQRALAALLEGWRIVRECRYMYHGCDQLPKRVAIEIAPEKFDFLLESGRQFWQGPQRDERLVTDLYVSEERDQNDSEIVFCLPTSKHAWLADLLARVKLWMDEHHFLRGQAFDAKGRYIPRGDAPAWEDVILPEAVRHALQLNVIDMLQRRELYKANGIPLRRGIILHGPPGTGKTLIGRVLAHSAGVTFILATPGMLEESQHIQRVFDWARRWAPTILFLEDFDMVAKNRYAFGPSGSLGEFLSCLDGVAAHEGIIAIATTNDLQALEPALRERPNRFDCVLEVPALGREGALAFLDRWSRRQPCGIDLARWAARAQRFTGAQLQELCRLSVIEAIEQHLASGETQDRRLTVEDAHMERAIKKLPGKSRRPAGFTVEDGE